METKQDNNEEIVIDIGRILIELKKFWKFIAAITLVFGIVAAVFSMVFITPMYRSETKIYLKPEMRTDVSGIDTTSINANSMMINNYMVMLKGDILMGKVAKEVNEKYTEENITKTYIKNSVNVSNENNTEMIMLAAVTEDPELSKLIVDTTFTNFSKQMKKELNLDNILVVDKARANDKPVSPNIMKNTVLGLLLGLISALGLVALKVITDKRLRTKEDAEAYLGIPVLATVPYSEAR